MWNEFNLYLELLNEDEFRKNILGVYFTPVKKYKNAKKQKIDFLKKKKSEQPLNKICRNGLNLGIKTLISR